MDVEALAKSAGTVLGTGIALRALFRDDKRANLYTDVKILRELEDKELKKLVSRHVEFGVRRIYDSDPSETKLLRMLAIGIPVCCYGVSFILIYSAFDIPDHKVTNFLSGIGFFVFGFAAMNRMHS